MRSCFCSVVKAWGTNLVQIFLFPQVFSYNPVNCLLTNIQTICNHLESGMMVFCQQTTNRFHVFVCSGVVLHVLPSVSKASIPPIHISMTHGSATISLINQFSCFHSTFTGFNTKFNCHSLLLHDAYNEAKNLHLQNKFVLTDHWTKTVEAWSHVTWSIVLRSYGVGC